MMQISFKQKEKTTTTKRKPKGSICEILWNARENEDS